MSDEATRDLTPRQERARNAVRDLPAPAGDPAFRARLKQDFVSGRLAERHPPVLALPWYRQTWTRWAAASAAAAALAVVVIALDRPPAWRVAGFEGGGTAWVDGVPVAMGRASALERRLAPGVRVRLPATAGLTLVGRGRMLVELTPGTDMTLPALPGRWFGRSARATIAGGEVHVTTGPAFRGARLAIETAEARIEVTGTTFAVLCLPVGTCVCVYEGTVHVGEKDGALVAVPAGRRREVFNDGTPILDDAMLVHEHGNLERLSARRAALLR